jgi:amidohydrolase
MSSSPATPTGPSIPSRDAVRSALAAVAARLRDTALAIHALAETAWQEHDSADLLADVLRDHAFEVDTGVAGLPTAFVGEAGKGGACVAFVCEYDALPGMGHACGHNLIGTGSVGAGIGARAALDAAGLGGRVRVVGAPAEESGGGKIALVAAGVFDDVDAALIFHPSDRTTPVISALACTHWDWAFHGRAAHAAGDPDQGLNALDAFVHAYCGVSLWRQRLRDGARVHGNIREGGTAPNVIPERTSGEFITRARDHSELEEMNTQFRAIFEAAALATGCRLALERDEGYRDLRSNPVLADVCRGHLEAAGLEPSDAVPWDRAASTDVGNLSYAVPTLHPEIAIAPAGIRYHTPAFAVAAAQERALVAMLAGAEALALTGVDVLADDSVREAVGEAFRGQPWRRFEWRGSEC